MEASCKVSPFNARSHIMACPRENHTKIHKSWLLSHSNTNTVFTERNLNVGYRMGGSECQSFPWRMYSARRSLPIILLSTRYCWSVIFVPQSQFMSYLGNTIFINSASLGVTMLFVVHLTSEGLKCIKPNHRKRLMYRHSTAATWASGIFHESRVVCGGLGRNSASSMVSHVLGCLHSCQLRPNNDREDKDDFQLSCKDGIFLWNPHKAGRSNQSW